ncbi:MAG: cyclic nucleotide-binding domain-containing protein [Proteobacteria bacterium]|nr:cyclic nucleotide-binding domain-containing protein [Pseudomonadota bacterium]
MSPAEEHEDSGPRPAAHAAADHLRKLTLFKDVDGESLAHLASELPVLALYAGSAIVTEGEPARDMYLVLSGEVEVVKSRSDSGSTRVALLGAGDWFGESALVHSGPRTATVRTVAPSSVLQLPAARTEQVLSEHDPRAYATFLRNIVRELLRRLRAADSLIAHNSDRLAEQYVLERKTTI